MGSLAAEKPHAVLVPYPAQGHINPFMQLAKLLHSKGFHITFVNNEYNHRRLIRSNGVDFVEGLEGFRFAAIPDGLPPSDRDATQDIPALSYNIHHNVLKQPFSELLTKLNSTQDAPPITCVIPDAIMGFGKEAADEQGIPSVLFWTASVCGFMGHSQYFELAKRGILPFKDDSFRTDGTLDTPIEWVPGMPNMRLKDLPSFMRVTNLDDIMFNYLGKSCQQSLKSSAILFNTFYEFEEQVLEAIKKLHSNIYAAGPLSLLLRHIHGTENYGSVNPSLWKEDPQCLEWLDKRAPESVVYVNYGSITVMSDQHLREFAWGLANSKHPFLWVVRPDVVADGSGGGLPQEFYDEIEDRGLIVSWCPQAAVLKHPSVGAYLSHCGWNSISESVAGGVPLLCWPFFAEQQTNCRYACTVWGTGLELNHDVKREELTELVKEIMEGEKGKVLRRNAKEWRRKAELVTDVGGSAYSEFERFVKEALHYEN
uniref:Glycosyltransferase n=1 Tax=Kalanchoe fedtschenkoi TaxID=63787 RepID=A0A7N1A3X6_KALFE